MVWFQNNCVYPPIVVFQRVSIKENSLMRFLFIRYTKGIKLKVGIIIMTGLNPFTIFLFHLGILKYVFILYQDNLWSKYNIKFQIYSDWHWYWQDLEQPHSTLSISADCIYQCRLWSHGIGSSVIVLTQTNLKID